MSACELCGNDAEAFIPYGDGIRCFDVYGCLAREARVMRAERDQLRAEVAALRERAERAEAKELGTSGANAVLKNAVVSLEAEVERMRKACEAYEYVMLVQGERLQRDGAMLVAMAKEKAPPLQEEPRPAHPSGDQEESR